MLIENGKIQNNANNQTLNARYLKIFLC